MNNRAILVLVRRSVAILMTLLVSLWLISPAFSAPSQETPSCCKRGGKHQCSMGKARGDGAVFSSAGCPQFQWQGASVVQHSVDAAKPSVQLDAIHAETAAIAKPSNAADRLQVRNLQSRGPPASRL